MALHEFAMKDAKELRLQAGYAKADGELAQGAVAAMRRWTREGLGFNATFVDDEMRVMVGLAQRAVLAGLAADVHPDTLVLMKDKASENRAGHEASLGIAITPLIRE